ncbi:MAG: L-serine ammonia-lyase [Methylococcaceae bacterium]|nr:L-serine ammonia-lyase [Methylococcaceae bacterium]
MTISIFDLFKIGIGPSSSHTVGPMRAALTFANHLQAQLVLSKVAAVNIDLYGSLGATGKGHNSDIAEMLGLSGFQPDTIDPNCITEQIETIRQTQTIKLLNDFAVPFIEKKQLRFHRKTLPRHANGMLFTAKDQQGETLLAKYYYSVGGGFIIGEEEAEAENLVEIENDKKFPYPFNSGDQLLKLCKQHQLSISQLMLENEKIWRSEAEIKQQLLHIWQVMQACVQRGMQTDGILPGGMKIKRRAASLYRQLNDDFGLSNINIPTGTLDWVNLFALAVSEENAAGGRVVTAPTNGAAGIIPAVLHYYWKFSHQPSEAGVIRFLLTAAAIGLLYKKNASISGAEVGCQGEVGVACSMAAAGLAEVLGGTPEQVENAAEIGMEHNLGLTCDPVGGLVQVPCIERNAMGAVKAINAARIALRGDGQHFVSLDKVIKTMRETGADMKTKYKETARGGLAVNLIEC